MSLSTNQSLVRGRFTSNGASANVALPWLPNRFQLLNITQFGSAAAATPVITAEWRQGMANNSVLTGLKTNGAATVAIPTMNTTQGVTVRDLSSQAPGAELTGTAITNADPAVVTINGHGLLLNDQIRLYNTTGMLQIAGLFFTVTNVVNVNSFDIGLDASGYAAPATAVNARILPNTIYYPRTFVIQSITQAAQAVVTINQRILTPNVSAFTVGQIMTFRVNADFGMVEMDGLQGEITAVNAATGAYTVDIDSTAFSAFAYPTSAEAAAGITFPQMVPIGKAGVPVSKGSGADPFDAVTNQTEFLVTLGTSAIGGNNDIMEWVAERNLSI